MLVPLSQANRKSSLKPPTDSLPGAPPNYDDKDKNGIDAERASIDSSNYNPRTIEGLRAEIEADAAAFGVDSVYDRT